MKKILARCVAVRILCCEVQRKVCRYIYNYFCFYLSWVGVKFKDCRGSGLVEIWILVWASRWTNEKYCIKLLPLTHRHCYYCYYLSNGKRYTQKWMYLYKKNVFVSERVTLVQNVPLEVSNNRQDTNLWAYQTHKPSQIHSRSQTYWSYKRLRISHSTKHPADQCMEIARRCVYIQIKRQSERTMGPTRESGSEYQSCSLYWLLLLLLWLLLLLQG